MILQIELIITLEKAGSINIVLYLLRKYWLFRKSVVNKNKNEYCYNAFLEKSSYKDKSNTEYF